jgi:hypothetical protein
MEIFWILGIAFVAVGGYLYVYSRKRSRLLKDFASNKGVRHSRKAGASLEEELEKAFSFDIPGIVRSFGRVRDVAEIEGITIFRATELLDLSPYGGSQNTHFGRIAAYFDAPATLDMFFLVTKTGELANMHPTEAIPETDDSFIKIKEVLEKSAPRHRLSVTVMRGKAIIYLEPMFGSEKKEDVDYLLGIAVAIHRKLWSDAM